MGWHWEVGPLGFQWLIVLCLDTTFSDKSVTSWWLNQPILKIVSSNWIIFPRTGVNINNIWNHHLENIHHKTGKKKTCPVIFLGGSPTFGFSLKCKKKHINTTIYFLPWRGSFCCPAVPRGLAPSFLLVGGEAFADALQVVINSTTSGWVFSWGPTPPEKGPTKGEHLRFKIIRSSGGHLELKNMDKICTARCFTFYFPPKTNLFPSRRMMV